MNKKLIIKRVLLLGLVVGSSLVAVGCGKKKGPTSGNKTYYSNEDDALIFSTQEVDKVFNPFFSTTATDSNVVGMTQIGMISNNANGDYTYGDNEPCVTKDLEIRTDNSDPNNVTTTYYFVLKNNVRFSNGSYLTIKDVLFNLYVYLDPAYTGSSTIYSTKIVGLEEYRTQEMDQSEQENFKKTYEVLAQTRINSLVSKATSILKEDPYLSDEEFEQKLEEQQDTGTYKNLVHDYQKAKELFKKELESDYTSSMDSYENINFKDDKGTVHKNLFTTDVEAFLYNEGYISWDKKTATLTSALSMNVEDLKSWTKEEAIDMVYSDKIPSSINEIVNYWATASSLFEFITNEEVENHFNSLGDSELAFPSISGIQYANRLNAISVNGTLYNQPEYDANGAVISGNEVLSITIKDVDPKAIWNFSFGVAPMYYYSDQEHINAFDFVSHFGVDYYSQTFMSEVVNAPSKQGLPYGAGAYAASCSAGGITGIKNTEFYNLGMIYFERNPYFVLGAPAIKKIRFRVVPQKTMITELLNEQVDFIEPNAKPETIAQLNGYASQGVGNKSIATAGYGYIGINAGKVPDLEIRQLIMHCINTKLCVDYYKTTAKEIFRSMSRESWAYPKDSTAYYPYIGGPVPENLKVVSPTYANYVKNLGLKAGDTMTSEQQAEFIRYMVEDLAGYSLGGDGIYKKGSHRLSYTFTVAGEEIDHPAWQALFAAGTLLNRYGFQINVAPDSQALKKLSSGALTVWAAAWGSTIDPDMFQVYSKDSTATSTLNWGYKQIKLNAGNKYSRELAILEKLSMYIDEARKIDDKTERAEIYSKALDLVMQMAVELPTYQRNDLFAYNMNKIDVTTFNQETSSYKGLTSNIHTLSLVVEK